MLQLYHVRIGQAKPDGARFGAIWSWLAVGDVV